MPEDMRETNKLLLRLMRHSRAGMAKEPRRITSWLDEITCSGCHRDIEKGEYVYHEGFCSHCVEEADAVEKRGVCSGEGEEPQAPHTQESVEKAADDAVKNQGPQGTPKKVGGDTLSKMAEEVLKAPHAEHDKK